MLQYQGFLFNLRGKAFPFLLALAYLWLAAPGCGRRAASEEAAQQALEEALAAQKSEFEASDRPQDRALCRLLEDFDADSMQVIERLLTDQKADPNCFCTIVTFHEHNRLLNRIPVVERYASDGVDLSDLTDPVHMALSMAEWPLLELLQKHGANLNGAPGHEPALNEAIDENDFKIVEKLLAMGADPKLASLEAVKSKKMAEKLLKLGCPASSIGLKGAFRRRDGKLVDYLLSQNPKPLGRLDATKPQDAKDELIRLLQHLLDQDDRPEIEIQWNANSFADELVELGACELFGRMVDRGLEVNNYTGAVPYMNDAIFRDDSSMVACLLRHGAHTSEKGFNAMEKAIFFSATDCIQLLQAKGIKVETGDNLAYARQFFASEEIIAILQK